jgi:phosphoribosylanthranilate isomerase
VQLVDAVDPGAYDALRRALPQVRIVQVIHVAGPDTVEEAKRIASQVDALLLDSGPGAVIAQLSSFDHANSAAAAVLNSPQALPANPCRAAQRTRAP